MILGALFTIIIIVIDQFIKLAVVTRVKPVGSQTIIPGLLNFTYVENRGAAFGILQNCKIFFITISIIMIAVFVYLIVFKKLHSRLFIISSVLIIGGGGGNFIDRIFLGYVIDYIQVSFFPPVCNFADYCITIGAVLLCIYFLFVLDKDKKNKTLEEA